MTENEWDICRNWQQMLLHISNHASERQKLLYICAGMRNLWHLLYDDSSRLAIEVSELAINGQADEFLIFHAMQCAECPLFGFDFEQESIRKRLKSNNSDTAISRLLQLGAYKETDIFGEDIPNRIGDPAIVKHLNIAAHIAYDCVHHFNTRTKHFIFNNELLGRLSSLKDWPGDWLVREVFGNPFRPYTFNSEWLKEDIVLITNKAYDERDFELLPTLANKLEEQGCNNTELLTHLRGGKTHVRGCWALELLLNKAASNNKNQYQYQYGYEWYANRKKTIQLE